MLLIGGACARFISLHAIKFYSPLYFNHFYPQYTSEFSEVNALFQATLGVVGSMSSSLIINKFLDKESNCHKPVKENFSKIIAASCLISVPIYGISFLQH